MKYKNKIIIIYLFDNKKIKKWMKHEKIIKKLIKYQ